MSFHASDAVWDASKTGAGTFEGAAAVRGFLEDWYGAFDELRTTFASATTAGGSEIAEYL